MNIISNFFMFLHFHKFFWIFTGTPFYTFSQLLINSHIHKHFFHRNSDIFTETFTFSQVRHERGGGPGAGGGHVDRRGGLHGWEVEGGDLGGGDAVEVRGHHRWKHRPVQDQNGPPQGRPEGGQEGEEGWKGGEGSEEVRKVLSLFWRFEVRACIKFVTFKYYPNIDVRLVFTYRSWTWSIYFLVLLSKIPKGYWKVDITDFWYGIAKWNLKQNFRSVYFWAMMLMLFKCGHDCNCLPSIKYVCWFEHYVVMITRLFDQLFQVLVAFVSVYTFYNF